ncbi:lipopolysaccharide transport periplasmic protein LptA [Massilia sp. TWR1-2-2]|uniref:lipopolysaccharide transport periplasmic protein LptA n=1 Tax=Massilia sp. TWR1-2-2 TaxID=2804584 RepID=UPI003CF51EE8
MKKILVSVACLAACVSALAERADALKPIKVNAESIMANTVNEGGTAEGNVVLTRGTLIMKAAKLTAAIDPQGYQFVTLQAAPGGLATFRQKKDGGPDLWIEGEAERIEYDDKTDVVKLKGRAKVRNLEGTRVTGSSEGAFISYDSRKEVVTTTNTATGESKTGGGRVEWIIDSRRSPAPAAPAPGKQ